MFRNKQHQTVQQIASSHRMGLTPSSLETLEMELNSGTLTSQSQKRGYLEVRMECLVQAMMGQDM